MSSVADEAAVCAHDTAPLESFTSRGQPRCNREVLVFLQDQLCVVRQCRNPVSKEKNAKNRCDAHMTEEDVRPFCSLVPCSLALQFIRHQEGQPYRPVLPGSPNSIN